MMLWTHPKNYPTYFIYMLGGSHDEVAPFPFIHVCFFTEVRKNNFLHLLIYLLFAIIYAHPQTNVYICFHVSLF